MTTMHTTMFRSGLTLLTCGSLLLGSCGYNTGEAGVKPVSVGYDPGELFPGPEPRGGLVDAVLMQLKGTNLDLGVTGLFGSSGSFTQHGSEPFESVLSFAYFFSPAIDAADEWQFVSPKGPDMNEACFVQINNRGPLGAFTTVDVGDSLLFSNNADDPADLTRLELQRDPQNYPLNTTQVTITYSALDIFNPGFPGYPANWTFGEEVTMHFDGGLPPEGTPIASIPRPSDAADPRAEKEAGDPSLWSPQDLTGVRVSNRDSVTNHATEAVAMVYAPAAPLPSPLGNDRVLHVTWDAPPEAERFSQVTMTLKLLGPDEPHQTDAEDFCVPAAAPDDSVVGDQIAYDVYVASKENWCDADFEPDVTLGNNESDADDISGVDNCHDGADNDGDGRCDELGCWAGDVWQDPDPQCARHELQTSVCGGDNLCTDVGGGRSADEHLGELICTAADDGDFVFPADQIERLLERLGDVEIEGAVLGVSRVTEELVQVPLARDQIGNEDNINPVRLRLAQVQYGRLTWE